MFCAGSEGKKISQWNSGVPIIHKETLKQVGIVLFGTGCGLQVYPGVYAKVSNQLSWIQSYVNAWSKKTESPKVKIKKPKLPKVPSAPTAKAPKAKALNANGK